MSMNDRILQYPLKIEFLHLMTNLLLAGAQEEAEKKIIQMLQPSSKEEIQQQNVLSGYVSCVYGMLP